MRLLLRVNGCHSHSVARRGERHIGAPYSAIPVVGYRGEVEYRMRGTATRQRDAVRVAPSSDEGRDLERRYVPPHNGTCGMLRPVGAARSVLSAESPERRFGAE